MKDIPLGLVVELNNWLGKDGIDFFRQVRHDHGTLNAILTTDTAIGGIPHPVHFREGMSVRNFMRGTGLCEGWDDHDYDDM